MMRLTESADVAIDSAVEVERPIDRTVTRRVIHGLNYAGDVVAIEIESAIHADARKIFTRLVGELLTRANALVLTLPDGAAICRGQDDLSPPYPPNTESEIVSLIRAVRDVRGYMGLVDELESRKNWRAA